MFDETKFSQDEEASVSTDNTACETAAPVSTDTTASETAASVSTDMTASETATPVSTDTVASETAKSVSTDNNTTYETGASVQANNTVTPHFGRPTPPPMGNGGFNPPPPTYNTYQFGQQPAFIKTPVTPPPKKPKNPKKPSFWKKALLVASLGIIFGVCAGGTLYGISRITNTFEKEASSTNTKIEETSKKSDSLKTTSTKAEIVTDVSQVVEEVMPSVVSITTVSTTEYPSFFGYSVPQESQSSGSGVIVGTNDTELLIVTNNHVVSGATSLTVAFADEQIASAVVKGTDANMDLAVIAVKLSDISEDTMKAIAIATIGDSTSLSVGEPAIAIGNALGYGQSVTSGIISALDREVTVDNVTNTLIQTDAAINPGNSGGALLNIKGELIGINSVKYSSTEVEGMGYAIPISSAMPIIEKLMTRETKEKVSESGYLGIAGINVDSNVSKVYNFPAGVYVSEVVDNCGAAAAGIMSGDIITEVEGTSITSMDDLTEELSYYSPGETVTVIIKRQADGGYTEKELEVTLSKKPN